MKERESWILYRQGKHKSDRVTIADSVENNAYKLEAYQPKFFEILKRKNDLINDIGWLSAAWFYFICRGRYKIYIRHKMGRGIKRNGISLRGSWQKLQISMDE